MNKINIKRYNPLLIRFIDRESIYKPRKILFSSSTGSGKSYKIAELLKPHQKIFQTIYLISPQYTDKNPYESVQSSHSRFKTYTFDILDDVTTVVQSFLHEIINDIKNINVKRSLIIMDDCISDKLAKNSIIASIFNNSRHMGVSVFMVSQSISVMINSIIKSNIDCIFLLKTNYWMQIQTFNQQFLNGIIGNRLFKMNEKPTKEKITQISGEIISNAFKSDWGFVCLSLNYNYFEKSYSEPIIFLP